MDGLKKPSEKIQLVDRLAISITKRKRSTPQKFLGGFVSFVCHSDVMTQH